MECYSNSTIQLQQKTLSFGLNGQLKKTQHVWQVFSVWCWLLLSVITLLWLWPYLHSSLRSDMLVISGSKAWMELGKTNGQGRKTKSEFFPATVVTFAWFPRKLNFCPLHVSWCWFHCLLLEIHQGSVNQNLLLFKLVYSTRIEGEMLKRGAGAGAGAAGCHDSCLCPN